MNTLIDDYNQPKTKYIPTNIDALSNLATRQQLNVVKPKNDKPKNSFKKPKNKASIKRLVIGGFNLVFITSSILILLTLSSAAPVAPTFKAAGTFSFGTGSITPPYPTGGSAPEVNDIALLVISSENEAISLTTANGFTEIGAQANKAAGTAASDPASRLAVYWKRCTGGDSAPVVADSNNNTEAQIFLFSGVRKTGNPWDVYAEGNDSGANDTSGVIPGTTTTIDNDLVVLITSNSYNNTTNNTQLSAWTNSNLSSITEINDQTNTAGLGGGNGVATGVMTSAGNYGNSTVTFAQTSYKGVMSIALAGIEASPMLALEGYTFENDDNTSSPDSITTMAGNAFSSGKTLSSVRLGERTTLRAHLTNSGGPLPSTTELGLFYDRGDGLWTQVKNQQKYKTSSGSGCGASGSSSWTCNVIDNDIGGTGTDTSVAFSPSGVPYVSFYDTTNSSLKIAEYVGSGGSGCGASGSSAWTCTTIDNDTDNTGRYSSLGFAPNGTAYISYYDVGATNLMVAKYVGSGGSGCGASGSSAWTCTTIAGSIQNMGLWNSLSINQDGIPYISYLNNSNGILSVAKYVGSGGTGCDSTTAWTCTDVYSDSGVTIWLNSSIQISPQNVPYISFHNSTASSLMIAKYVGSGGSGCGANGSTAWSCTTVDNDTDNTGNFNSLAFAPDGNPFVSYYDTTATALMVAKYVGGSSGTGCGTSGSSAWTCTTVDNDTDNTGQYNSLAFAPDGNPFVSYNDSTATSLMVAKYVGSGGSGCGASGSSAWTCTTVDNDTNNTGQYTSLAFTPDGNPFVSYHDATASSLMVAKVERSGEIQFAPSFSGSSARSLLESHVDMTSSSDSTGRDDSDCLVSATWNNGIVSAGSTIGGLSLPSGSSTKQCTEVAWTIDTSQAISDTTYRFMIASKDSFRPDKGVWRGPVSVATDAYPTLTTMGSLDQSYKYSKDVLGAYTNNNCGGSGSTAWTCTSLDGYAMNIGTYTSLAISPDGTPYISYFDITSSSLMIAKYVGSGGVDCNATGSNLTNWSCTTVDNDTDNTGQYNSLAFAPDGTPYISYYDYSASSLMLAKYVGSGGTGCGASGSTAWTCTTIDNDTDNTGENSSLAFASDGTPYVSYYDISATALMVAKYVGSGGSGCGASGSTAWTCTTVDNDTDNTGQYNSLAFAPDGTPYISYYDYSANSLMLAKYVGSGGTGCGASGSTAWTCTTVDNRTTTHNTGQYNSLAFSADGTPYISYYDGSSTTSLRLAKYVGSGGNGCNDLGSTAWTCITVDGDTDITGEYSSLAFDKAGIPYISYYDNTSANLMVAKMKMPETKPNQSITSSYNGRNADSGNGRYWLNSGTAPFGNWQGTCGGTVDLMGYCGLYKNDGQYDSLNAQIGERPLYNMSTKFSSNTVLPTAKVYFKSSVAPSSSNVVLQAYRFGSTNGWETIKTISSSGCDYDNCYIEAMPSGTPSEYFEQDGINYWIYFRVYQLESYSSGITFKLDMFRADQPQVLMRGGRVFRENLNDSFTFTR